MSVGSRRNETMPHLRLYADFHPYMYIKAIYNRYSVYIGGSPHAVGHNSRITRDLRRRRAFLFGVGRALRFCFWTFRLAANLKSSRRNAQFCSSIKEYMSRKGKEFNRRTIKKLLRIPRGDEIRGRKALVHN